MLRIPCPFCGVRDETEFRYRGDATARRPADDAPPDAWTGYVYLRENPAGWHTEFWLHTSGCRQLLRVERDTVTHAIRAVSPTLESP